MKYCEDMLNRRTARFWLPSVAEKHEKLLNMSRDQLRFTCWLYFSVGSLLNPYPFPHKKGTSIVKTRKA